MKKNKLDVKFIILATLEIIGFLSILFDAFNIFEILSLTRF